MAETRRQTGNRKRRIAEEEAKGIEKQERKAEREAAREAKKQKERAEIIRDIDSMISVGSPPEWHEEFQEEEHERIPIDKEQFEKLCSMFCTGDEIGGWFYCSQNTVNAWCKKTYGESFSEVYTKLSMRGHISLRRLMLHHASRNAVMSIFLAKNYLGMKDNPDDNSQAEIIAHLDEIKNALQEAAKNPVIDVDTGMVYDAEYAEEHAEDTAPIGKVIEVSEDGD